MVVFENNFDTPEKYFPGWLRKETFIQRTNSTEWAATFIKSVAIKSFQESMMRPILGLMFRFEKSLRKYHARVRNKNPQLGFFILSFWTVFLNIYISLMNLILENSFFGVNHFVRLIMISTNLMFTSWLFEITGSCITTWWLSSPKAFSGTWRTSSECKTP